LVQTDAQEWWLDDHAPQPTGEAENRGVYIAKLLGLVLVVADENLVLYFSDIDATLNIHLLTMRLYVHCNL